MAIILVGTQKCHRNNILTFTLSLPKRQDTYKILAAMNMKSNWFMLPSGLEKYLRFIFIAMKKL